MSSKRTRSDSEQSSLSDANSPFTRESTADSKIPHLDAASTSSNAVVMKCALAPHPPLEFTSFEDYEVHYQKTHTNRCSECHRNFPDEHFLHLHIAENHDPITAARKDRGEKTYACLLPTCPRHCSTPQKRRLHCIDAHAFPRNYDFYILNDGIDLRSSMLRSPPRAPTSQQRRRRSSTLTLTHLEAPAGAMEIVRDEGEDGDGDEGRAEEGKEEGEKDGNGDGNGDVESVDATEDSSAPRATQRAPLKLRGRGRGGFARGRGRGRGMSNANSRPQVEIASSSTPTDAMEAITSRMSSLQFVPNSVRLARGKGT